MAGRRRSASSNSVFSDSKRNCKIKRKRGLAFVANRRCDEENLVRLVEIIQRDCCADRAYSLAEARVDVVATDCADGRERFSLEQR